MIRHFILLYLLACAAGAEITFTSLLHEMTDRSVVTHWPATEYLSLQASSTNRAAKTPDDPNGWFANSDCNFEIRKETNDGRTESVLMEHEGPGVITRIWTPFFYQRLGDRKGTYIRIYIDGETTPRIQGGMIELLTGGGARQAALRPNHRAGWDPARFPLTPKPCQLHSPGHRALPTPARQLRPQKCRHLLDFAQEPHFSHAGNLCLKCTSAQCRIFSANGWAWVIRDRPR